MTQEADDAEASEVLLMKTSSRIEALQKDGLLESEAQRKDIISQSAKKASKARRDAMMGGLDQITGGMCQDVIYGILNLISTLLVAAQFVVNLYSLFGGVGCNKSSKFKMADLWFFAQLFLNGVATIGQLFAWVYMCIQTILFCWHHQTFPTSKISASSDPESTYIEMRCQDYEDFDDLDEDQQRWVRKAVKDEMDLLSDGNVPIEFKKSMKAMTKAAVMQNHLSNFRAIIGAVGAIVEPSLTASSAFKALTNGTNIVTNATKLLALTKCEATRNTSAAASGIIAAIGLKQSQMKTAYARLIGLDQIRDEKLRLIGLQSNIGDEKLRLELTRFDIAAEAEMVDILGAQGKSVMTFMSGKATQ